MAVMIRPSFAKGEVSDSIYGRVDTAAYQIALRKARNLIIHATGGASNRSGSVFIGPALDHSEDPRPIPFQFKTTDEYMLFFGDEEMFIVRNDALVTEATKTITGITQANPAVVSSTSHGYENGNLVYIEGVVGMTRVNGRWFRVAGKTTHTFQLVDHLTGQNLNSTALAAYSSGGTAARVYTVATPYDIADVWEIKYTQSADVMTLTHKSYEPQELRRTGHAAWAFTVPAFEPSIDFPAGLAVAVGSAGSATFNYRVTAIADETAEESLPGLNNTVRTITGITQADPAVVSSTSHGFTAGQEVHLYGISGMTELNGRRFSVANPNANDFELEGEDSTGHTAYSSGGSAALTFVVAASSNTTRSNTISWTAVAGAQKYAVYLEDNGLYGLIGETEDTSFLDDNIAADLDLSPPRARNPFREAGSYPGAVGYYEQRRVFGGSEDEPDTSYYSQTGNQSNMSVSSPTQADDAITATLNALQVNEIRHYVPGNDLLVFTSGSEWKVNAGPDAAFEAATLRQKMQTVWGASHRPPIMVGSTVLYVDESEARIRSFGYSLQIDGYTGTDLTLLADHLFAEYTIVDWAFTRSPDPSFHIVREDGTIITMTFQQEQEVVAFSTWDTKGKYRGVGALRRASTDIDERLYMVVQRRVNGATVRYIERRASRRFTDVRDCFFVDCGLSYDEPVTITGATSADPVVITAAAHGFSNGDQVDIFDIIWEATEDASGTETQPDQLNGSRYLVANKATDTFEITDLSGNAIDGSAFDAYVEGGTVRKAILTLSGLDHLEGASVVALCDGNVVRNLTVASGAVTFARRFSRIHIGLSYVADLETLDIEAENMTIQGQRQKISSVTTRFRKSRGLLIGPGEDNLTEMKQREFENMGDPTALLTGDKKVNLPPHWKTNGRLFLRQKDPLPMTILALVPDIAVEDRGDE